MMQNDKKVDPQRTIVLYTSKYGAAETYARWIAEALGCRAVPLDKFSKKELQGYDTFIYGGGVQAGGIRGLEQFTKWIKGDLKLRQMAKRGTISEAEAAEIGAFDRQYYIFAVGISLDSEGNRAAGTSISTRTGSDLLCFFPAGCPLIQRVLAGVDKAIIKVATKMFLDKPEVQAGGRAQVLLFETGCDLIDRMRTTALIESVKSGAVPEEFRDTREPEPKKSFWKR